VRVAVQWCSVALVVGTIAIDKVHDDRARRRPLVCSARPSIDEAWRFTAWPTCGQG
jgi:hypothetical protein